MGVLVSVRYAIGNDKTSPTSPRIGSAHAQASIEGPRKDKFGRRLRRQDLAAKDPAPAGADQAASYIRMLIGYAVQAERISGDKVQANIGRAGIMRAPWKRTVR